MTRSWIGCFTAEGRAFVRDRPNTWDMYLTEKTGKPNEQSLKKTMKRRDQMSYPPPGKRDTSTHRKSDVNMDWISF